MAVAKKPLGVGLIIFALLFVACRQGQDAGTSDRADPALVGTYSCSAPGDPNPLTDPSTGKPSVETWELQEGGKLRQTSPTKVHATGETVPGKTVEGTWSGQGDSGEVKSEFGEGPFKVEGNRLVLGDGEFICTKTG